MKEKHTRYCILIVILVSMLFVCVGCTMPGAQLDDTQTATSEMSTVEGTEKTTTEQTTATVEASTETTEQADEQTTEPDDDNALDNLDPAYVLTVKSLPSYTHNAFVILNDNKPAFGKSELTIESFESYSELDSLGRCGVAYANVGTDLMPTEERGEIGNIKPSGWHTVKYNDLIEDNYLYNRCHLIAFQLTGENDNVCNLITGTRYLNIVGMQPFENQVAEYVKGTGNHVLYRVTPVFEDDNLVATGVEMEAYSVEDCGKSICFHVFCYNVQPAISIDYATGESWVTEEATTEEATTENVVATTEPVTEEQTASENQSHYILNTNTRKFHETWCRSVSEMKEKNKQEFWGDRQDVINAGYTPCKRCNP